MNQYEEKTKKGELMFFFVFLLWQLHASKDMMFRGRMNRHLQICHILSNLDFVLESVIRSARRRRPSGEVRSTPMCKFCRIWRCGRVVARGREVLVS